MILNNKIYGVIALRMTNQLKSNLKKDESFTACRDKLFRILQSELDGIDFEPNKEVADTKAQEEMELIERLASDEKFAIGWTIKELVKTAGHDKGNVAAIKELREMLGIKDAKTDLIVNIIDFKDADYGTEEP